MDFLLEALMDILIEGATEGAKSNNIPKWIRIALLGIIIVVCCAMIGLFISFCISSHGSLLIKTLLFAVCVIIAYFLWNLLKKVFASYKQNKRT